MYKRLAPGMLSLMLATGAAVAPVSIWAQEAGVKDPARWYTDLTTPQDRFQNARKEAAAAYQQALGECKSQRGAAAIACKKEARKNFDTDLMEAKKLGQRR
ncbi:MAG: hypothetical protein NVSMB6_22580 [Burkholderiaceae bacterium]